MRAVRAIGVLALMLGAPLAKAQEAVPAPQAGDIARPSAGMTAPGSDLTVQAILTIDQEELFAMSRWGQRVQIDLERKSREIADENERLATTFSDEEAALTALRDTLPPDEFRKRADEFDERVVGVRRERDRVARELQEQVEEERAAFFRAALPILAQVMRERGASVVLEQRSVFVSAQSTDITAEMIARLDGDIGEGPATPATGDAAGATPAPQSQPEPTPEQTPDQAPVQP